MSRSAFGAALTRHVGVPPGRYARGDADADAVRD